MNILKSFNIKIPILMLKALDDNKLGIIDAQNALRIIDLTNYAVAGGFKSNIMHERIIGTHVDMTPDGKISISMLPGTNKAAVFSVTKKELLYKVGRHQGEIESVGVDPNGRYCVTCGQDGKAFAWVLKTARLAFSMPPHADFITTVAFNDNGQWIATGSYDRTINLLNLATMKQPLKLRGHTSAVMKIQFLPEARILSVDKEGTLIIWDMRNGKMIKRLTKMNDEVTTMTVSQDKKFAFIATKLGSIGLYDLHTLEQIKQRYIKISESVTSLALIPEGFRLAIGTAEGSVRIYSLLGDDDEYMKMIRERRYKVFYDALEENPMLFYSKPYEVVERVWADVFEKARLYLEKNEKLKAKELLDMFTGIPKKNALITQILRAYEKYAQFQTYVQEGRFALAYSQAKQFPAFQDTEPYRKMEIRWKKLFMKAQELILTPNGDDQARQLLTQYRGISEKTVLIQQLFEQRRMYEYMKKIIAARDFVKFFDLIKMHPFLKEFSEYNSIIDYANKLYTQAQKGYMQGDYASARKACEILSAFPDYALEAQEMADTIRVKHLFFDAISSNNLANAFSYLSSYPLLYETPEAQVLERQWNLLVDQAQRIAAKGMASETLAIFEPYFSITDKYAAIASIMTQVYCVQLEQKLRDKVSQEVIEKGIQQYIGMFGIDEGIMGVVDYFKSHYASKIDLETLKQGSIETWTPSIWVKDICIS
ncbi:WD40 repeat domain-containing protein [Sulfuricurvum sp.]|uniref:WD40 repeat domain-containing protein n=1 Tax=Sulfuricurvum sp. TaxID=2025608 RepID=UPI003BB74CB8